MTGNFRAASWPRLLLLCAAVGTGACASNAGRPVVADEDYAIQDEEVLVTDERDYACGCRTIRHEYHDGSVSSRVVRHDGTILVDELLSAE